MDENKRSEVFPCKPFELSTLGGVTKNSCNNAHNRSVEANVSRTDAKRILTAILELFFFRGTMRMKSEKAQESI